jgi:transcriptional regulator with XRE-family HTH domain
MNTGVDTAKLAAMVRARRGEKGLRAAADEIGEVSPSTLSRIEQGRMPDLDTFFRLCRWLGVSADELAPKQVGRKKAASASTPAEQVEVYLRADQTLPPETVDALVRMVKLAYDSATNE